MVEVQCLAGSVDAAARSLDRFAKSSQEDADWHCAAGMVAELQGDYDAAVEHYENARQLQPGHAAATFRLAYHYDLHGEEETAGELYRECIAVAEAPPPGAALEPRPIYANALMNLAVLYEDAGRYDDAARCLQRVLAANPVHARARLFLKDVLASKTMAFDEDEQKRLARRNDLLAIPITDFELSVRARNCLKKMNIRTLGDLLHVTEQDLLGFKNFGETSLTEIKNVLSSKNLRLGQLREEPAPAQPVQAASGASVENEGVLATPISQIEFSVRARRALQRLNVRTLGELASKTEAELLACRNFGQTSLNEVQQRLAEYGLNLRFSE
jgi:DNA-directed RNA polymerase subunit alpha